MRRLAMHFVLLAASIAASCARPPVAMPDAGAREEVAAATATFRRDWLAPAKIAPPTIDFAVRTQSPAPGIAAEVRPALPEKAPWNAWPGGPESRLFNNRAGLMFEVRVAADGAVRWIPERTSVRINGQDVPIRPAATPDEVLVPLLGAALQAERFSVESDLVDRTRAAGPFRAAYLPLGPTPAPVAGVVIFPLPDPGTQVANVVVALAIEVAGREFVPEFVWD